MEQGRLGQDDFGISAEGLHSVAEAMVRVSADTDQHQNDIWDAVIEMLDHTAAFVHQAGADDDVVAMYRFRALLKAAQTCDDERKQDLMQHPKYADQLLIRCWVPAFGNSWQRILELAYGLSTELRYARKYLAVLVWLLSRVTGRTRETSWARLSYSWLVRAEKALLEKLQTGLTAN